MTYKKYNEEELRKYLLAHAEIKSFYVTCLHGSSAGLINYFDSNGKNWCLMEDDDNLVSDAVEFLKTYGAPHFEDIKLVQQFEKNWGQQMGNANLSSWRRNS